MRVTTTITTMASNVTLTEREIEILTSAQRIVNALGDELDAVDTLGTTAERIFNNLEEIGNCLDNIVDLVDMED